MIITMTLIAVASYYAKSAWSTLRRSDKAPEDCSSAELQDFSSQNSPDASKDNPPCQLLGSPLSPLVGSPQVDIP